MPFPLGPQPSRSWAHHTILPLWHRVNKVTFLRLSAALPRFAHARLAVETVGWFHSALRFSRFHATNTSKRFFGSLKGLCFRTIAKTEAFFSAFLCIA